MKNIKMDIVRIRNKKKSIIISKKTILLQKLIILKFIKMKKTLVLLASVAFALVMLSSCNSEPKPLTGGQWDFEFLGEVTSSYQFNDDCTGRFISSMGDDYSYDFTYEIKGDSLIMNNGDLLDLGQNNYTYKIDGDELTLKGGILDSETTYKWAERK